MTEPTDVQHLVKQVMVGASPEESQALLEALLSGQVSSIFERLQIDQQPTLYPVPTRPVDTAFAWTCMVRGRRYGGGSNCVATSLCPGYMR